MTLLLNLLLPALTALAIAFGIYTWKRTANYKTVVTRALIPYLTALLIYSMAQPSYMPKGEVPKMRRMPVIFQDNLAIEDNLLKPDSDHAERIDKALDARHQIDKILSDDQ